jgi:energy-coupling factor transport system ATP-binding protein
MSILVENLSFVYDQGLAFEKKALIDVSFTVNDGEIVGIIGQSGSGKSTLVQHLNGLIKPQKKDQVIIDGLDLFNKETDLTKIRQKVGIVFQYPEMQLFEETVEKDVAFGPKNLGFSKDEIQDLVIDSLKLVGLSYEDYVGRSPLLLSGGEKRRIAIAGILAMKPDYLILDEPTAGLDPFAKEELLKEIVSINQTRKAAIVLVSHDMDEIAEITNRIYVLKKGVVVLEGFTNQVFKNYDMMEDLGLSLPESMRVLHEISLCTNSIQLDKFGLEETTDEIVRFYYSRKKNGN